MLSGSIFPTDSDDNSADWLGQPMHMKMQSTSQEILRKNSLCFVTSFFSKYLPFVEEKWPLLPNLSTSVV